MRARTKAWGFSIALIAVVLTFVPDSLNAPYVSMPSEQDYASTGESLFFTNAHEADQVLGQAVGVPFVELAALVVAVVILLGASWYNRGGGPATDWPTSSEFD